MSLSPSDRVAIAAHLHVLLRRRTGRVTDTEWMAVNEDYARAMVAFARERAAEDNAPELEEWAQRLERAWDAPLDQARQSFMESAMRTVAMRPGEPSARPAPGAAPGPGGKPPGGPPPPAGGSRYVGGLR
ncbi:MAG: hypothetical protein J0H69_11670 [Burkholderiales bacterium]|nr:hypothetical protein [Burkholderiales bacterium]